MFIKRPKAYFSILLPIQNDAGYLPQILDSILEQSFRRWELLVIDNESQDHSEQVIRAMAGFDPRIRHLRSTLRQGKTALCEYGVKWSQGEYLVFSEPTSQWEANHLAKCFVELQKLKLDSRSVSIDGSLILRREHFGAKKRILDVVPEDFGGFLEFAETLRALRRSHH